jgi:hypothetical protein
VEEFARLVSEQGEALRAGRWQAARRLQERAVELQEELEGRLASAVPEATEEERQDLARALALALEEVRRQEAALRVLLEETGRQRSDLLTWRRRMQSVFAAVRSAGSGSGGRVDTVR